MLQALPFGLFCIFIFGLSAVWASMALFVAATWGFALVADRIERRRA